MIDINVSPNSLTVKGHSGYADRGNDIVCAGVSALTQAAILGLRHYGVDMDVSMSHGEMTVQINKNDEDVVKPIFTAMVAGLKEIAKQYPENVRLKGGC
jgi:uncharacterized protein YsxB (DUF464 family)